MLTPGMVIDIPDVVPETPNVYVAPGGELAKAGYATTGEIAAWYKANPNYVGMPSAFTTTNAGTIAAKALPSGVQAWAQAQNKTIAPAYGQPGGVNPQTYYRQLPTITPTVSQTAESRQRQFYTGQPTLQTTQEALQRPGYAQPVPVEQMYRGLLDWQRLVTGINPPQRTYQTPVQVQTPTPTTAPKTIPHTAGVPMGVQQTAEGRQREGFVATQPAQDPITAIAAVLMGTATQEQVDYLLQSGQATAEELTASGYAPTGATPSATAAIVGSAAYLYANPYYSGGAGPEMERNKAIWGNIIYQDTIYQNVSDYAEQLASEPLRNSGLMMGLFNWRGGW